MKLMEHDDDCGELLDAGGQCPRCGFHPDGQSVAFREVPDAEVADGLRRGRTFLGLHRRPITAQRETR